MKRVLLHASALVAMLLAAPIARADADWPMAGHDAARTGCGGQTLLPPYQAAWTRTLGPSPFGVRICESIQVVSVGDLAYVGAENGELHALKVTDGSTAWKQTLPSVISGSACVAGGVVIQGCEDGGIYAFDALSGQPKWQAMTGAGVWSSPCAVEGTVFVTSKDSNVYAVEVATGKQRWKSPTAAPIFLSPACAGGKVFVGSEDMCAYAFDAATGKQLWKTQRLSGESFRDWWPVVASDVVFLQSQPLRDSSARGQGYKRWLDESASRKEMREAMVESITADRSIYQVCFALRTSDGTEPFIPPVNLNGGANHVPHPLFLTPDGLVGMRNAPFRPKDNKSRIMFMDPKTGTLADRPFLAGGMQVRDESSCYGAAAGWIVMLSQGCWCTAWDARTGKTVPAFSGPGWHEGGGGLVHSGQYYQSPISAANGRLFLIYPSMVRCFKAAKTAEN